MRAHRRIQMESFKTRFRKSTALLRFLQEKYTGLGVFDPLIQKKKDLIMQLIVLSKELDTAWEDCLRRERETAKTQQTAHAFRLEKRALREAMRQLYELTGLLEGFQKKKEKSFKKTLTEFNNTIKRFNNLTAALEANYTDYEKNKIYIEALYYGETLSLSMSLLGSAIQFAIMIVFACQVTLSKAAELAGQIFYPITAAFNSIAKLFGLMSKIYQLYQNDRQIALSEERRKEKLKEARALLASSATLRTISLVLNTVAVFVFAGLLATNPVGWILLAVATTVDWIETGVMEARRTEKEYRQYKIAFDLASHEDQASMKSQLEIYKSHAVTARNEERWGRVNVVAMILFACAPIPVVGQVLLGIGLALFSIAAIRNVVVAVNSYRNSKKEAQGIETSHADSTTRTQKPEKKLLAKPKPARRARMRKHYSFDIREETIRYQPIPGRPHPGQRRNRYSAALPANQSPFRRLSHHARVVVSKKVPR